jgi:uncharacterized membrane protein YbhN (UPF0104 family)
MRALLVLKLTVTVLVFAWLLTRPELRVGGILDVVRAVEPGRFLLALALAVFVKLLGILGNVWRWQVLLRGQEIPVPFTPLLRSFFIGRWFGVVTPGTLGLDGYRIWDSARFTQRAAESVAVVVIDKVVGLVALALLALLVFPLGRDLLPVLDPGRARLVQAGIAVAAFLALTVLLAPRAWRPVLRLVPTRPARIAAFLWQLLDAAQAYGKARPALLAAVGLALLGHATTALMYVAILWGVHDPLATLDAAQVGRVLWSAVFMTCATLIAPTVGGEGVREFVFVRLLAGFLDPARAFLFGHVGFWVEKTILSIPGGIWWWRRRGDEGLSPVAQRTPTPPGPG